MSATASTASVVQEIARAIHQRGGRALLVGGCVRDSLLGSPRKDYDLEVFGLEPEVLESTLTRDHEIIDVGRSFGVLKIRGHAIDVALPRRETKVARGHKGFAVDADPHLDVGIAAARRDLTVNAIYEDPLTGELIDPLNGRQDLEAKLLRHCSERFVEDPLRLLRVMQFAARFEFDVAADTVELCRTLDLDELPRERVEGEFRKLLLQGTRPSRGLHFLEQCGALRFFPEIEALCGTEQNPEWHPEGDVFVHTGHCLDHFARHRCGDDSDWIVGLAVLCHDLGKPATTEMLDGVWRSLGHSQAGEDPTRSFLGRLTLDQSVVEPVVALVREHLIPSELFKAEASDRAIRRLATRVDIPLLVRVAAHDSGGRPPLPAEEFPPGEWLLERAKKLDVDSGKPVPLVLGRHLIGEGLSPGPEFKRILDQCFEAQLDGVFGDLEGGLSYLREFLERSS